MKNKEQLQEEEYIIPYHHTIKRGEYAGISYYSVLDIIKKVVKEINPKNLLDFGCGDGKLIYELSKEKINLTGIDISKKAISFAKIFTPTAKFINSNIINYIPKEKFDLITSIETLEHLPPEELKKFIIKLSSLLKKDGYFIITVPSNNIPTSKKHYQHFDIRNIKDLVGDNFKIIKLIGHYKLSKIYEILYAISINNHISITSPRYQAFLNNYFKKNIEKAKINNCRRLIVICKKLNNSPL
jgi:SAM-dependent methyltransferase